MFSVITLALSGSGEVGFPIIAILSGQSCVMEELPLKSGPPE
jgi:hypothetical protein